MLPKYSPVLEESQSLRSEQSKEVLHSKLLFSSLVTLRTYRGSGQRGRVGANHALLPRSDLPEHRRLVDDKLRLPFALT